MLRLVSWQNFHHDIASILQPAIVHSAIELHIHATTRSVYTVGHHMGYAQPPKTAYHSRR